MKRLTKRLSNSVASWNYSNDCYGEDETKNKVFRSVHHQNACEKLAAIEDILGDEYDLDRLRELLKADREEKIPKYTIGDTVYDKFGNCWEVEVVELHSLHTKNEWLYKCVNKDRTDFCGLWEFEVYLNHEASDCL